MHDWVKLGGRQCAPTGGGRRKQKVAWVNSCYWLNGWLHHQSLPELSRQYKTLRFGNVFCSGIQVLHVSVCTNTMSVDSLKYPITHIIIVFLG